MEGSPIFVMWFRQDLRLSDNPAFAEAAKQGAVYPIYILDDENAADHAMGSASRVWLHHSLASLDKSLNHTLSLYKGDPLSILSKLTKFYNVKGVFWNRCYEPWQIKRDTKIKSKLESQGLSVHSHNGSLLWEPWTVTKQDKTPYKVFTPFYRKGCLNALAPRLPLAAPTKPTLYKDKHSALSLNDLSLLPKIAWDKSITDHWPIGEDAAHKRLSTFLAEGIDSYKEGRNFPAYNHVSRLSPHLHFGQISPNQAWYSAQNHGENDHTDCFCSELGWREFSYNQLYHNPALPSDNVQQKFNTFPWQTKPKLLKAWQKGQTGIPIVDAGMRELWQTGSMHNRVRMVVGSFLVKNLLIHWQEGQKWFWDCLVDADLASNSASWQWVAGSGADAAPFFRIFNPVTQGQKFDPDGQYTKRFVPELANLPKPYLFNPWLAPDHILKESKITLGKDYPLPIIDLAQSRNAALRAFQTL